MKNKEDWYRNLKYNFIKLYVASFHLRLRLVTLLSENSYLLADENIEVRVQNLISSENNFMENMVEFIREIKDLEDTGWCLLKEDLLEEFFYLKSIFHFEVGYYRQLEDYIRMIDDYQIQGEDIVSFMDRNEETSDFCYQRMKDNYQDLKRLKRERRNDYFE